MSARIVMCAAIAALAVGCGGGADAFRPTFPDNRSDALREIAARLAQAPAAQDRPVAVGLTEESLYAYDLEAGTLLWEERVGEPQSAPHVAGDVVILHEGGRIVGRRVSDGRRTFEVDDTHLSLIGAAGEGDLAAFVLSTTGGVGAASRVYVARGGSITAHADAEVAVGAPAVRGDLVIVPWGSQNVSFLDGDTGTEVARMRSLAGVVSHATVQDGQLYFGQAGVGRLTPTSASGAAEEVGWTQPETSALPGGPPLWRSAYDPPAGARSAEHRIRVSFSPRGDAGPVSFSDDTVYLSFYRLIFGLAPSDLSPRFAYQHPSDVVGARAVDGGVIVADATGGVTLVGSDGQPRWTTDSGKAPSVVALRLGAFRPQGSAEGQAPLLAEQLLSVAQSTDARLVPGRAFAVSAMAGLEDEAVTGHLIVLCDDRSMPAPIWQAGCAALARRTTGGAAVLTALRRHASFLEDTVAPAVGPLATVAARLELREAVPLLVGHLSDPGTRADDLPALAEALAAFGDQSAAGPLRDFLWLYHAEADEALTPGLVAVARALVQLAGPAGRDDVQEVLDAPFTAPPVRAPLSQVVQAAEAAEGAEAEGAEAEDAAAESGSEG